ncbi:MAG: toxin [Gammaproteobacteria bacterium]|nr:toxin [Gammaproteobacteria bacterium]
MDELEYEFNAEKNSTLKEQRGISFEEIIYYISNGYLLDTIEHPNKEKYAGQQFYVVDIDGYVYLVPFVRRDNQIFLKTIFPSRKHTKQYLEKMKSGGESHE